MPCTQRLGSGECMPCTQRLGSGECMPCALFTGLTERMPLPCFALLLSEFLRKQSKAKQGIFRGGPGGAAMASGRVENRVDFGSKIQREPRFFAF